MLCALTVRKLKPGTFEDFRTAFMARANPDDIPAGWVRFNMIRSTEDPDEVVCFGFFDGTLEELRAGGQGREGYDDQMSAIAPYVESVGADSVYEIVEDYSRSQSSA
jgi:heme-degrading monooxygenase HmoA